MAIPTNLTAATAIDLGAVPASVTQDVFDTATTYTVWYKITAPPGINVLGLFGFGDLVGYKPLTLVYIGPDTAPVAWPIAAPTSAQNKAVQFPVVAGTTYYFEFRKTGNFATSMLSVDVLAGPTTAAQTLDIFINDDTEGYQAAILDPVTGDVRKFIYPFPAGEAGDVLTSGVRLYSDEFTDLDLKLYSRTFVHLADVPFVWVGNPKIRSNLTTNTFWVGSTGNGVTPAYVTTVDASGALGGTTWTLPLAGLTALATSPDETILYYVGQAASIGSPIGRWDLVNNVVLPDLVAGVASHFVSDILGLGDGTLLASYFKGSVTRALFVRHYAPDGSILSTFTLGGSNLTGTTPRMAYGPTDGSFVILWHQNFPAGFNRIQEIRVSDGAVLMDLTKATYEVGVYQPAATATPTERFGASFSCPISLLRAPDTATLTVIKETIPGGSSSTFNFTTTGGLTPPEFPLIDGESQVFDNLTPGTYGVEEGDPPSGWTLTGITVSNGDPAEAIALSAGDDVTVTFTNTLTGDECPGLVTGPRIDGLPYVPFSV